MRVTKAQAEQNRAHIVATAARLFRERGYDGVGVADLMAAAGFTHGGFYKHFRSKADLWPRRPRAGSHRPRHGQKAWTPPSSSSATSRGSIATGAVTAAPSRPSVATPHASRRTSRTEFVAGIENLLTALQVLQSDTPGDADQRAARAMVIDMLAHSVGAVMLSRACPDGSPLADEILDVCRAGILASLTHGNVDGSESGGPEA